MPRKAMLRNILALCAALALLGACASAPPAAPTAAAAPTGAVSLPAIPAGPTSAPTGGVSLPAIPAGPTGAPTGGVSLPAVPAGPTSAPTGGVSLPEVEAGPGQQPSSIALPLVIADDKPLQRFGYRVRQTYPHDPAAFTQGLAYLDGTLYEGTGLEGRSSLRRVELATGQVLQQRDLPPDVFGEGIAVLGERIYQLTWQDQTGYVYDRASFELQQEFSYAHEGWGLTTDGARLIVSDGSATIRFWDPQTLQETGRIEVREGDQPVTRLNELEYIDGAIFANVWQTDRIARIDPASGQVTGWLDLSGLLAPQERAGADVLNGIAYDAAGRRLFVTGKLWPKLFVIELVAEDSP